MTQSTAAPPKKMDFHFGKPGALSAMLTLVVFMIMLVASGRVSLRLFWVAGFAALCVGFLFAKDKKHFNDATVRGLTNPIFSVLVLAFFLAGILSNLLAQSGLVHGMIWAATSLNLNAAFIPAITFCTCVIISTACGTTGGTISAVLPLMLPLSISLGCNPAVVMGALISGSYFGDNLAPISDTTIASSFTQESKVPDVVRTRLKYSIIAGGVALVLFVYTGMGTTNVLAVPPSVDASYASSLIMLLIPGALVVLMLRGWELVPALIVCDLLALALNLAMGFMAPGMLVSNASPILNGVTGMLSITVFCVFLFIIIEITRESGIFDELIGTVQNFCKTARQTEIVCAFLTIAGVLTMSINTVAIVVVGPIVRQVSKKFHLDRRRSANIIDGLASATAGVLPYNGSFMLASGLALGTGLLPDDFSVLSIPQYSYHCIMLFVVYFAAIFTGFGRLYEVGMDAEGNPVTAKEPPRETAQEVLLRPEPA